MCTKCGLQFPKINHLWPDAIVFTCFLFYPLAATTLPEASSDAQDVAQAPQVETADAAEAGDALVPKQEWDPHIPTSHVHHSAGSMQQFEIFMIHIYVLDIFRLHTEDVPSAQRSHGRSCKFFLSIMRLHFPIPPRESASEVPEGDLMDVAAPGEGEAVPLQKLIGFGMVGGYSIFGMDADHVQAQAYHFVDLG